MTSNRNVTDWRPFEANGAIEAYSIVHLNNDGKVQSAKSAANNNAAIVLPVIGVIGSRDVADGETVDVATAGIAPVKYHAAINAGQLVGAAEDGHAQPLSSAGNRIIGIATEKGVADDIGAVLLAPGSV